jgi:hypothetical protein
MSVRDTQFAAVDGGWRIADAWGAGDRDCYRRRDGNLESGLLEGLIETVIAR